LCEEGYRRGELGRQDIHRLDRNHRWRINIGIGDRGRGGERSRYFVLYRKRFIEIERKKLI
jgi:hypothetical protein